MGPNTPISAVEAAACPELTGHAMSASFDAQARADSTIRAFVQAAGDLARAAALAEAEVHFACEQIGSDLGLSAEQLAPTPNDSRVEAACAATLTRIDAILAQGAQGSLKAQATPPQCTADASFEAECKAQCSVEIDPGYIRANCQPGQLYGRCAATCQGSCGGTCDGACKGECEGSTEGGTCKGRCNGTCEGSCQGDCKGSCSVELQEPKCAVALKPPTVDPRCEGSCKADAEFQASCTPAQVRIDAAVSVGELPSLVAALEEHLPALIAAQVKYGARIADDIQVLVQTGAELPRALGQVSARAASCIAAAANATLRAQASIRVTIRASASISTRAGVSGGT
ncbi:MAG: hypothetical protein ABW217_20930 [Polyangiaceae bacterium]